MIVCPNCNHPNPDGAVQCEACYTPLPATTNCPGCGATVQADASFCGQCGQDLRSHNAPNAAAPTIAPDSVEVEPLVLPDPLLESDPMASETVSSNPPDSSLPPTAVATPPDLNPITQGSPPPTVASEPMVSGEQEIVTPPPVIEPEAQSFPESVSSVQTPEPEPEPAPPDPIPAPATPAPSRTQLQQVTARLVHVRSDTIIELPQNLSVIHIGKQNDRIPPDIDVSGFENSEVVSRVHADIRVEGDAYYAEDVGSSNGTYINGMSLLPGNRHRLRPGDRISLGKGDLVTFLFQIA